ncbi:MAG: hypothetical protein JST30_14090 [Armatimonadetes bacterium]|nr:hypothetical protein [Armatimonadota bacterium]
MNKRPFGAFALALVSAFAAAADRMYSGTWEVSGQGAGTLILRVRENGTVTGAVVGNTGERRSGHLYGTYEGKRFKLYLRLRGMPAQQFQGNFTRNDEESHMDGLQYVGNKPKDDVKWTMNAKAVTAPTK